jgi:hypothetical protein
MVGMLVLFLVFTISTRVMEATEAVSRPSPPPLPLPKKQDTESLTAEEYKQLSEQVDQLTALLNERRRESAELSRLQSELLDLIATKEAQLKAMKTYGLLPGIELEPKQDVRLRPDDRYKVRKKPRFLEVTASEYVLQPDQKHFPIAQLKRSGSPLRKVLATLVKNRDKEYLLLLIHPNGADAYVALRVYLLETYPDKKRKGVAQIDLGYEPYSPGWVMISQELQEK